jgi:hypothetical protein
MNDEYYIEHHYSMYDILRNCGNLTLVHPNYMKFAKSLTIKLLSVIDVKELMSQGSNFCKRARETLMKDKSLFLQFEMSINKSTITSISKKQLYDKLLTKAFNARFGAEKKRFVQEHMGHCSSAATVAFRESLQVFNKKESIQSASNFSTKAVLNKKNILIKEDLE